MAQILFEGVSKRYLRGSVDQLLRHPQSWRGESARHWFWVLEQIALTVDSPGARLGLVGTNGSGKTTLLRIIAGVTAPTAGLVVVNGRVAPVIEPVAGMQPELTGRENIYLMGTILGMRRREIQQKFDAIVDFSGVAKFVDMPLKHYSLGMTMRLGFSTAIFVHADIILVDEAWGMGDAEFQVRSFEQIRRLQAQGVTSIVVSHDVEVIRRLTNRVLWLQGGRVQADGQTEDVLKAYLTSSSHPSSVS